MAPWRLVPYDARSMKAKEVDEHSVVSFDGTSLAYHLVGQGLPVLLCNGLGGSWMAWSHQIDYLSDRYRFLSWDYRGLYRSGPPAALDGLSVEHHAQDALAVLDAAGIERTAVFGWSMGVQVGLELFRRAPDRVAAFMLMNGVPGNPWETVLDTRLSTRLVPKAIRGAGSVPGLVEQLTRRLASMPETIQWIKRLGLASQTLDEGTFHQLAESFSELDMGIYLRILEMLGAHDATDVLAEVDVPTLVIAGARDRLTPRSAAARMARQIRGSELMVVPGGTHYLALEYPELVNLRIEKFFRERGYCAPTSVALPRA